MAVQVPGVGGGNAAVRTVGPSSSSAVRSVCSTRGSDDTRGSDIGPSVTPLLLVERPVTHAQEHGIPWQAAPLPGSPGSTPTPTGLAAHLAPRTSVFG